MTGPEHYRQAEQLLAEANEIIRFRQQPEQSGPPDLPERNITEAHVHATLAVAAATAVGVLDLDSRAWADVAGTK